MLGGVNMSCVPEVDFNKIIYCYNDLGEKNY